MMNRTAKMQAALDTLLEHYTDMMGRVWKKKLTASMRTAIISLALRYWNLREELREIGKYRPLSCVCKLDRLVITTPDLDWETMFSTLGGDPLRNPRRLWKADYLFVRRFKGTGSIREVVVAYEPTAPWLAPYRITIIPKDRAGTQPEDLRCLWTVLPSPRIALVEIAWDFPEDCLMDLEYVQRFGLFGKTWFVPSTTGNPFHQKCGSTGSKIVRAYFKWELYCFRVELELHSQFLMKHGINNPSDFPKLAEVLIPDHIHFSQISDAKLTRALQKKALSASAQKTILERAKQKARVRLWAALRYLRTQPARLQNVLRNLDDIHEVNDVIRSAANKWAAAWRQRWNP